MQLLLFKLAISNSHFITISKLKEIFKMAAGKKVIVFALLLSLVLAQTEVEAKSCCPNATTRKIYNVCRVSGVSKSICATVSGCKIVSETTCPGGYVNDGLQNNGDDIVTGYCKLGCALSECRLEFSPSNSDASEIVNGEVEKCTKKCYAVCSRDAPLLITAVETD